MKIDATAQFWRTKGLSVRASNCLAKANIANEQELIHKFTTFDSLIALRNCGRRTAKEIGTFITNLSLVCDSGQGSEINSSNSNDERSHSIEEEWVFLPLLDIIVSAQTWEALQKISVNSIPWGFRTRSAIKQQRLQVLADLCQFSSRELLSFSSFSIVSLRDIREHLTETIEQLQANTNVLNSNLDHFFKLFIPLLNIKVSAKTWEALQNRPIHQLTWSGRVQKTLLAQGFETLADIAELAPPQWLMFRNFGRKSLTEIEETVNKVIANPDVLDPKTEHSVEVSQIQTLLELGHVVFQRLQIRQQEVVKYYYGYNGTPKNLQQIGEVLGITGERVRQIKKTVNNKLNQGVDNYLITTTIFRLLSKSIRDILSQYGGFCSVEKLQEIIRQRLGWGNSEQWIINWFNEAFGEAWICSGTDDYKVVDGICDLRMLCYYSKRT